jgi:hypothetical protein
VSLRRLLGSQTALEPTEVVDAKLDELERRNKLILVEMDCVYWAKRLDPTLPPLWWPKKEWLREAVRDRLARGLGPLDPP